jgi:general nucleoside transport system permease protein
MKKLTASGRFDGERVLLALAAPVLAVLFAMVVSGLVLVASGKEPFHAFQVMIDFGSKADSQIYILNHGGTYYLAAIAAAFGFRMNLFNIGIDGQYRIGAFFAAVVGGAINLPAFLQIPIIIATAMLVGGMWAGIAGLLKVRRGVSEVISTIMLNAITTSVVGYLLSPSRLAGKTDGYNVSTPAIPASGNFFTITTNGGPLYGFVFVAVVVGIVFHLVLSRTRFGFDLRATGRSESAATASGVNVKRMVLTSMVVSGALAGLIGMPQLLQDSHAYDLSFPPGIGFTGIAIALLGRNNPVGVAVAALFWAFLDRTAGQLDFEGYPNEIVSVMQGVIVLSVVVAYELVRRYALRRQQQKVGEELAAQAVQAEKQEVAA